MHVMLSMYPQVQGVLIAPIKDSMCGAWLSHGSHIQMIYLSLPMRRSDDDGFPVIDYNDVYKIKDTLPQDEFPEDLPEAEVASLGSISIADAEIELADFDAASEDSVF